MKRLIVLAGFYLAFCGSARAAASSDPNSPRLQIEQSAASRFQVSFPSVVGKRYQVYRAADVNDWEFLGRVTNGTGGVITIPLAPASASQEFFRLISNDAPAPIPLGITDSGNHSIRLSFVTDARKDYLILFSFDLQRWDSVTDVIGGTGDRFSLDLDTTGVSGAYFRAGTVWVLPLWNMVRIPPGTFVMGSPKTEQDRDLDEDPLTNVTLTYGFWAGKYEVTQGEYEALMGTNPSTFKGGRSLPVEQVTWTNAVEYCARLTSQERAAGRLPVGFAYRLPTEAEFEYMCRAGASTRFSFGDDPDYSQLGDYAWYAANSGEATHPVGQKKPNGFGLYDIYGNVWEWCFDWYQDAYQGGSIENPIGPLAGQLRVFRGGGWDAADHYCRSAYRNTVKPVRSIRTLGFRIVLSALQL